MKFLELQFMAWNGMDLIKFWLLINAMRLLAAGIVSVFLTTLGIKPSE